MADINFRAAPQIADKGKYLGKCNRTACPKRPANWYNPNMQSYYCSSCGLILNRENQHMPYWKLCFEVHSEIK